MSKYTAPEIASEIGLTVELKHTDSADVFIDSYLQSVGIDPDDVQAGNSLLREIATLYAKRQACIENAITEDSPLFLKARELEKTISKMMENINNASLGITTVDNELYGSVTLERG